MNTLLTSLLFFGCVFLGAQYAQAKIIHVNSAAGVGGNGTSWLTACRFLQDALAVTEEGDEVWVAAGTYYPDDGTSITKGDRSSSFTLKQDVKLIGGFAGGETDQDQRNPDENISILSGEIWTDKIYWSLHVVTFAGSATLDGFTVMKGNANGETTPHNQGAAIYAPNTTTPVIANCRFLNNTASSYGGAIFSASTSSFIGVSVTKCIFSNNTASSGGAIYANSIYEVCLRT